MDIGKPLFALILGIIAWGLYSAVFAVFRKQLTACYRIGRIFAWRSLVNGLIAYGAVIALAFAVVFLAKTGGFILIISLISILTLAGWSVGLMLAGSLIFMLDGTRRPYLALAAGVVLAGLSNISADYSKWVFGLIGIYGLGAIIVYLRGGWLDLPAETETTAIHGITPLMPGQEGLEGKFSRSARGGRTSKPAFSGPEFLLAAAGLALLLVLPRYAGKLQKAGPLLAPRGAGSAPLQPHEASDPVAGEQQASPVAGDISQGRGGAGAVPPGAIDVGPYSAVAQRVYEMERPTLDLQARMWAYRIQDGEFSAEELKGDAENWIMSDAHKADLLGRIDKYLEAGNVRPLTRDEHALLESVRQRSNKLITPD